MNKKNNSPKRTFIPQLIGDTVKKINRSYSSKYGKIEFIIQSKWEEITGSYFFEFSEPENIIRLPDYENDIGETIYKNYLNVSVTPAAALEFQHFKDKILQKINSYFGYQAIIDIRIKQNYIPKQKKINKLDMKNKILDDSEKKIISSKVEELNNSDLKKSLFNLGKNMTEENK